MRASSKSGKSNCTHYQSVVVVFYLFLLCVQAHASSFITITEPVAEQEYAVGDSILFNLVADVSCSDCCVQNKCRSFRVGYILGNTSTRPWCHLFVEFFLSEDYSEIASITPADVSVIDYHYENDSVKIEFKWKVPESLYCDENSISSITDSFFIVAIPYPMTDELTQELLFRTVAPIKITAPGSSIRPTNFRKRELSARHSYYCLSGRRVKINKGVIVNTPNSIMVRTSSSNTSSGSPCSVIVCPLIE